MRHPFAVGIGLGAGLVLWWKRRTIAAWLDSVKAKVLSGPDGSEAVVKRVMASGQPAIIVIASGYDGPRVQALLQALRNGAGGAGRTIIDAEGWPSSVQVVSAPSG